MEPLTASILASLGMWTVERWRENRARKAKGAAGDPGPRAPAIEPTSYPERLTRQFTERRAPAFGSVPVVSFARKIAPGLYATLRARGVVQVPISIDPPDGPQAGRVVVGWKVVPQGPGVLNAGVLLDQARALGATVLASHSAFFLPQANLQAHVVLVVGGPDLTQLAAPGGFFAVLPAPEPAIVVPVEPPAESVAPASTATATPDAPIASAEPTGAEQAFRATGAQTTAESASHPPEAHRKTEAAAESPLTGPPQQTLPSSISPDPPPVHRVRVQRAAVGTGPTPAKAKAQAKAETKPKPRAKAKAKAKAKPHPATLNGVAHLEGKNGALSRAIAGAEGET